MDLFYLFDEYPQQFYFENEIIAVRDGLKPISVVSGIRGDLFTAEQEKAAFEAGLLVINAPMIRSDHDDEREHVRLYIAKPENLWRVQALEALSKILEHCKWSYGTEYLESYLLGYSPEAIDLWLKSHQSSTGGYGIVPVFCLLDGEYREKLKLLGDHCLHPNCGNDGISLFYPGRRIVPKRKAFEMVPPGMFLARLGIKWRLALTLLNNPLALEEKGYLSLTVALDDIPHINAGLQSPVAIFGPDGWSSNGRGL